jgi:UDP-N-acetyl-D-glucosamine dehydrogenase
MRLDPGRKENPMDYAASLAKKIEKRRAVVGVIGLGYVGLPLAIRFSEERFRVLGFDVDSLKVKKLNDGKTYIKHVPAEKIKRIKRSGVFEATADMSRLKEADVVIICVPTPLDKNKEPDMRFIETTADEIARHIRKGQLISLESTTYPGTTREVLLPKFERNGWKAGEDFFLLFSPEREDPGNPKFATKNTPKLVGGITPRCLALGAAIYAKVVDRVISVRSPEIAEFAKIYENTFRCVNIALVNELKVLADRMNVDIWDVIDAASSKPFGFMPFYPGPGLGGHCIPIDPFYLAWKARELNFHTRFIELAGEINTDMPEYVLSKLVEALNARRKCLKTAKILVLGLAYKKDVDDLRESPSLEIIQLLQDRGARVYYHDPFVPKIPPARKYRLHLSSSELTAALLKRMDAVLIVTDHSALDYGWVVKNSKLVVDTRNACRAVKTGRGKVVKA